MKAHEILLEAATLVAEVRARQHGDKEENFAAIAKGIQWWMEIRPDPTAPISAWDVGNMWEIAKIARRVNGSHNIDDYTDAAGYAGCTGEIADKLNEPTGEGG